MVQDEDENEQRSSSSSRLSLRQGYANALLRMVNGLVDPLQLGAYARSIASIAAQLGLPLWLVELRHAATHEDLPSLEVLREGARQVIPSIHIPFLTQRIQSMAWLFHNYWLPTINPSSISQDSLKPLRPLEPLLKDYKKLMKITTRDVSLRSQYKQNLASVLREIERWISEARVQANALDAGNNDVKERWALDQVCEALTAKGALVPLSKKCA